MECNSERELLESRSVLLAPMDSHGIWESIISILQLHLSSLDTLCIAYTVQHGPQSPLSMGAYHLNVNSSPAPTQDKQITDADMNVTQCISRGRRCHKRIAAGDVDQWHDVK